MPSASSRPTARSSASTCACGRTATPALVCCLDSLENYFITQGREWERYAWIKARVMNEGDNLQPEWVRLMQQVARPFVFRKYLDFGAINAMRDLHAQIRREVAEGHGRPHQARPRRHPRDRVHRPGLPADPRRPRPALQIRATLQVLDLLVQRKQLPPATRDELSAAYDFLRRLEHRLQYVDDAQTHTLPQDAGEGRTSVAASMGFADWDVCWPPRRASREGGRAISSRCFPTRRRGRTRWTRPVARSVWREVADQLGELGFCEPPGHGAARPAAHPALPAARRRPTASASTPSAAPDPGRRRHPAPDLTLAAA